MTSDFELHTYRVGHMFDEDRVTWPEGPHLWMDEDAGIRLALFLTAPSQREITAIESGTPRFGWVEDGFNAFLLFKFGDAPWSDAPFNPQRLTEPFDMEPMPRGTHRRVFVFLVHADNGRIAAMRTFSWPAYFVNTAVNSVRRLDALPAYGEPEARAGQQDFYRRYPDGPSLYRLVTTLPPEAKCQGGQKEDVPFGKKRSS